jgi:hypothetical protein
MPPALAESEAKVVVWSKVTALVSVSARMRRASDEFGIDIRECVGNRFVHAHRRPGGPKLASALVTEHCGDQVAGFAQGDENKVGVGTDGHGV